MSKFFKQLENLPKDKRDQIFRGLLATQSLVRSVEQDGFNIPDEIAVAIALFDRAESDTFAKALFDLVFRGFPVGANNGDSSPWHWVSTQNISVIKSLLCWLVHKAEGAIAS